MLIWVQAFCKSDRIKGGEGRERGLQVTLAKASPHIAKEHLRASCTGLKRKSKARPRKS